MAKQKSPGGGTSKEAQLAFEVIVGLVDSFCREHLNEEYAVLCRRLAEALSRKRPSPIIRGKPESWACGIVRAIGHVNFLGDPAQPHHMKMSDVDEGFGVSEATGSAKSRVIRDLFQIQQLDLKWTLPNLMEQNPMAWMIQVNGLIVDARRIPREIQEEAFRMGLIPFIPGQRPAKDNDD